MVHILLKASTDARRKALAESIHAARVRRRVVVALIEGMVRRGHPAYRRVRMDAVRARAAAIQLPEDGRFPSLVVEFGVGTKPASAAEGDPLRPQKMATPADSRVAETEDPLRARRPSAIVEERSSILCEDSAAAKASALRSVVAGLRPNGLAPTESARPEPNSDPTVAAEAADSGSGPPRVVIRPGTEMVPSFDPLFFGVAFAFAFPFGIGLMDPPDFSDRPRPRRPGEAPLVDALRWCRVFARRVEAQYRRDWTLGFAL